jgi:hypothetical protein
MPGVNGSGRKTAGRNRLVGGWIETDVGGEAAVCRRDLRKVLRSSEVGLLVGVIGSVTGLIEIVGGIGE